MSAPPLLPPRTGTRPSPCCTRPAATADLSGRRRRLAGGPVCKHGQPRAIHAGGGGVQPGGAGRCAQQERLLGPLGLVALGRALVALGRALVPWLSRVGPARQCLMHPPCASHAPRALMLMHECGVSRRPTDYVAVPVCGPMRADGSGDTADGPQDGWHDLWRALSGALPPGEVQPPPPPGGRPPCFAPVLRRQGRHGHAAHLQACSLGVCVTAPLLRHACAAPFAGTTLQQAAAVTAPWARGKAGHERLAATKQVTHRLWPVAGGLGVCVAVAWPRQSR